MSNILITSAGRRVSLVREFQKELKEEFIKGKVFTTDMNPTYSSACQVSDGFFKVSRVTEPCYIEELISICVENNIKMIIPTIDTELLVLSSARQLFLKKGVFVIVSDIEFVKKCRDKRIIHEFFATNNIEVAKEIDKRAISFPFFAKPYDGSCSVDLYHVANESMLTDEILNNKKLMFLEYLDLTEYDEYTIDMYYDQSSILQCIVPRLRIEVRSGEVNKGVTVNNFLVNYISERLSTINGVIGCITLQVFVHKITERVVGIEINPRFGGGYPLSYNAGANFPKMLIKEILRKEKIEFFKNWKSNLLMLRYDDEIIVESSHV